jgi:MFS family permease
MTTFLRLPCDEGVIRSEREGAGCAARDKPLVLAATILGSSMAFIDGSVVNIALPAMQADLAGSVQAVQWIVNGYTLMLGALILVGGLAGDACSPSALSSLLSLRWPAVLRRTPRC